MIWYPFTQEKNKIQPINITHGDGVFLYSKSGQQYIDAISSWWVNIHGHGNQELANAIFEQAKKLEHIIFTKFSHAPAQQLTKELSLLLPYNLNKFFFSDNGSTAVEVALKMAYQYFKNNNIHNRNMFLALKYGYHGDTIGAMSVSDQSSIYHSVFADLLFQTHYIDMPENFADVVNIEEKENIAIQNLQILLEKHGKNICALIVEPLIQGAAGMKIYRAEFLDKIVSMAKKYNILIIFDEVMTGFFRTGTMFAFEQTNSIPDFLCISKGLTGGCLPLSLTITNTKIYEAFLSDDNDKTFMHGHSYTANPISCAAACCSLQMLFRPQTQQNIMNIVSAHKKNLPKLNFVQKKRQIGTIAAFDVQSEETAQKISDLLLQDGIFLRPLSKTLYILPPYCITKEQINFIYEQINFHISFFNSK